MIKKMIGLVALCLVVGGTYDLARTQSFQGPTTPTSLLITLDEADIALDARRSYSQITTGSLPIDVVQETGHSGSLAGIGTVPNATYGALRFTFDTTGSYTGIDPCKGTAVSSPAAIQFPGTIPPPPGALHTKEDINFMVPHPVTGLKPGYLEMKPLPVSSDSLELRLVFQATNSVICASSATPSSTISGEGLNQPEGIELDPTNQEIVVTNSNINTVEIFDATSGYNKCCPLKRVIAGDNTGDKTGLSKPMGLYVDPDPTINEIGVANSGNNSVTIYNRQNVIDNTDSVTHIANVAPNYIISSDGVSDNTKLSIPGGVALYSDPSVATNDEIVVTNSGNNSVTIYNRQNVIANTDSVTHIANVAPVRTLVDLPNGPSITGLNLPCGVYVDGVNNEIGVADNGNDSVTIYNRQNVIANTDSVTLIANVAPNYIIIGSDTGLSNPCGIYVDTTNNEIGVANSGNNTITIYNRQNVIDHTDPVTHIANVAPVRTLRGDPTGLGNPVGIYVDMLNDEIGVANAGNSSLTFHKRNDTTAQLKVIPDLTIFTLQQELHPQYIYAGTIKTPPPNGTTTQGDTASMNFSGYNFIWGITDSRIRQPGDASGGLLIPPSNVVFELTDGSLVSNLGVGCGVLTPFTHIQLSTNCSGPLIHSPYPAGGGTYTIVATLFKETTVNHLPIVSNPIKPSQVPWPVPTLTLFPVINTIKQIDWNFVDQAGGSLSSPIIYSQEIQITLTQPIASVSACYKQVSGNAQTLVFNSGPLAPDLLTLSTVKNNGCDINLNDVDTIVFAYTDAMNNSFVFNWKPQ